MQNISPKLISRRHTPPPSNCYRSFRTLPLHFFAPRAPEAGVRTAQVPHQNCGREASPSSSVVASPKGILCNKSFNIAQVPPTSWSLQDLNFTACVLGWWVGRWIRIQGNHHNPPEFLSSCTVITSQLSLLLNPTPISCTPLCSLYQNHLASQAVRSPKVEGRMTAQASSLILGKLPLTSRLSWAPPGFTSRAPVHGVSVVHS